MLTRVYVDNYKCFSNFEWSPGKLVLLAGRNGSGKSSVMDLVTGIARLLNGGERLDALFPTTTLTRWERRQEQRVELDVQSAQGMYRYELRLDHSWKKDKVRLASEKLSLDGQVLFSFEDGEVQLYRDDRSVGPKVPGDWTDSMLKTVPARHDNTKLEAFRRELDGFWLVELDPKTIEATARGEVSSPSTSLDDFVAWYRTASGDSVKVQSLVERLRPVIKDLLGLKLETTGRDERLLQVMFQLPGEGGRKGQTLPFDLDELSDGQRILIVLYSILEFGPVRDGLLCFDEPDNYLALEEIEPWLGELEATLAEGNGQVFLASHNSEVINRLWTSHGVWFERDGLGPVRVKPMPDAGGLTPAEAMARGWV